MSAVVSIPLTNRMYPRGRIKSTVTSSVIIRADIFFDRFCESFVKLLWVEIQISSDKKRYAIKGVKSQTKARIERARSISTRPFPWL